jgi:superfamily II DNA or RNA helicase
MKTIRPYQATAIRSVHEAWTVYRSTLLVLPTGAGKSFVAASIVADRAPLGRTLWVAHRRELITQARDTLEGVGIRCDVEMAESWARLSDLFGESQCVVASKDSLVGNRLARFDPNAFQTIVFDECHHSTATKWLDIAARFPNAKLLGLTATPDRADGVALGNVYECVAFEYGIRDAIRDGFLSPIVQKRVECSEIDLRNVRTVGGDLDASELAAAMRTNGVLHQIAQPLVKEAEDRSTICFTASVDMAHAMVETMPAYTSARCVAIDGTTPADVRKRHLADYAKGDVQFIFNCAVLTEGFDAPRTSCIAMARPTKSRSLYAQCLGRGTRLYPGKLNALILDFVGNAGKHKLVNPLDVLAGKPLPDDVKEDAEKAAAGGMPSEEALAMAERESVLREERAQRERLKKARAKAKVSYRMELIDPFGDEPATEQAITLYNKGRFRKGLCSYKQGQLMARKGLSPDLTKAECGLAFEALKANGWQTTPEMRARWGVKAVAAE